MYILLLLNLNIIFKRRCIRRNTTVSLRVEFLLVFFFSFAQIPTSNLHTESFINYLQDWKTNQLYEWKVQVEINNVTFNLRNSVGKFEIILWRKTRKKSMSLTSGFQGNPKYAGQDYSGVS